MEVIATNALPQRQPRNIRRRGVAVTQQLYPNAQGVLSPAPVVVQAKVSPAKSNRRKRNRQRRRAKKLEASGGLGSILSVKNKRTEERYFLQRLLAPDVYGPFRQPRSGASDRTGLGFDVTTFTITGDATTNKVQGVNGTTVFNSTGMNSYAVASQSTGFGAPTTQPVNAQFPAASQLADVNLTSMSLVAYYTGNPLNVQGELLIGSAISPTTTTTYNTLYYYPGFMHFPVAELINKPVRVVMRKLSPAADEFVTTATGNADCDVPYIFTSGLPTGGTLVINCYRTWEYRSSTVSTVPYEKVGPSFSQDLASFQDAKAEIANMPAPVTPAVDPQITSDLTSMLGLDNVGFGSAVGLLGMAVMRQMHRLGGGGNVNVPHGIAEIELGDMV